MKIFMFIIAFILISSCESYLSKQDYLVWLRDADNGYYTEFKDDEFLISAYRVPSKLKALNELNSKTSIHNLDSIASTYDELQYFQLVLTSPDGGNYLDYISGDQGEYFVKQSHLENDFKNEISLVCGNDTVLPYSYIPERTYGLRPETIVNLGFLVDYKSKAEIYIHSEELNLKGIRLLFLSKDQPQLKLN